MTARTVTYLKTEWGLIGVQVAGDGLVFGTWDELSRWHRKHLKEPFVTISPGTHEMLVAIALEERTASERFRLEHPDYCYECGRDCGCEPLEGK